MMGNGQHGEHQLQQTAASVCHFSPVLWELLVKEEGGGSRKFHWRHHNLWWLHHGKIALANAKGFQQHACEVALVEDSTSSRHRRCKCKYGDHTEGSDAAKLKHMRVKSHLLGRCDCIHLGEQSSEHAGVISREALQQRERRRCRGLFHAPPPPLVLGAPFGDAALALGALGALASPLGLSSVDGTG